MSKERGCRTFTKSYLDALCRDLAGTSSRRRASCSSIGTFSASVFHCCAPAHVHWECPTLHPKGVAARAALTEQHSLSQSREVQTSETAWIDFRTNVRTFKCVGVVPSSKLDAANVLDPLTTLYRQSSGLWLRPRPALWCCRR